MDGRKFELYTIRDESTDASYGAYPADRSIEQRMDFGFILLDKPSGIRSKTEAATAKKILAPLGANKIGYSGTLED